MKRLALLIIPSLLFATTALSASTPIQGGFEAKSVKAKKVRRKKAADSAAIAPKAMPSFSATPATAPSSATIMAYKRDPVPIFDDAGSKLRDVPKGSMPKANSTAARVVGSKPGFVAIMLDGSRAWLRLTAVDYAGNLTTPPCEKVAVKMAMMEEDGVERSLGLGCKAK